MRMRSRYVDAVPESSVSEPVEIGISRIPESLAICSARLVFTESLTKTANTSNCVIFRPKKNFVRIEPRLDRSEQTQERLETEDLDVMDYEDRWGRYRIRLSKGDIKKHSEFLSELLAEAHGVD